MSDFATTRPNWARMSMNDALNNFNEELAAINRAHNLNRPGHRGITDAVVRESTIQAMVDAVTTVAEVIDPLQWQLAPTERFRSEPFYWALSTPAGTTPDPPADEDELFMQVLWEMRHDEPYPGDEVDPNEPTEEETRDLLDDISHIQDADELTRSMTRAGRIDRMIYVSELDKEGVEKLINVLIPSEQREDKHGNCWMSGPGFSGLPCGDPEHNVVPEQLRPPEEGDSDDAPQ